MVIVYTRLKLAVIVTFPAGMEKMRTIMRRFREPIEAFGGKRVLETLDYAPGLDGLPKADVLKFVLEDDCSVIVRPSGTEPKVKAYVTVSAPEKDAAVAAEKEIRKGIESFMQ